ncbi:MAG: glutamate-cysteine ligase family protein, partial [Actinomycetota bacterium]|nr:glutamate-cysteine ligase family protein [Actinomycetota bacterium]
QPDQRARVLTHLRPWLPVLLALSASSPRWQGHDTGYASFRYEVWRRWPTAGPPPVLDDMASYNRLVDELVEAGAVPDASYLYWDARPSTRHPTVEVRSLDPCLDPADATAITGLVRALAWHALEDDGPSPERAAQDGHRLEAAMWRAARYGLDGDLLGPDGPPAPARAVVERLLDRCRPGLQAHGDELAVREQVAVILERGNGASIQRALTRSEPSDRHVVAELLRRTRCSRRPAELVAASSVA